MDKSYVTMEQNVCTVCGCVYDTGSILLDQRLRNKFDRQTITGWGMCEEHAKLRADGYVALVAIDEQKSQIMSSDKTAKPDQVYRTGPIAHVKEEAFFGIFSMDIPDKGVVFCQPEVIEMLQQQVVH